MEALSKIVAIFVAVILLFLAPLIYTAQKQDLILQTYVLSVTASFVDTVKNTGKITPNLYQNFIAQLDQTGNLYAIHLERSKKVFYPGEEEETYLVHYESTYESDMLTEIYEGSGSYHFNQGDYFSVQVYNRSQTFGERLQGMLIGRSGKAPAIQVSLGGAIRDETN